MLDSGELEQRIAVLSPRELNTELVNLFPQLPDPTDRTELFDKLIQNANVFRDAFQSIDQTNLGATPSERMDEMAKRMNNRENEIGGIVPDQEISRLKNEAKNQDLERAASEEKLDIMVTFIKLGKRSHLSTSCINYLTARLADLINRGVSKKELIDIGGTQVPKDIGGFLILIENRQQDPHSSGLFDKTQASEIEEKIYQSEVAHLRASSHLGLLTSQLLSGNVPADFMDAMVGGMNRVPIEGERNLANFIRASKDQLDYWATDYERTFGHRPKEPTLPQSM